MTRQRNISNSSYNNSQTSLLPLKECQWNQYSKVSDHYTFLYLELHIDQQANDGWQKSSGSLTHLRPQPHSFDKNCCSLTCGSGKIQSVIMFSFLSIFCLADSYHIGYKNELALFLQWHAEDICNVTVICAANCYKMRYFTLWKIQW